MNASYYTIHNSLPCHYVSFNVAHKVCRCHRLDTDDDDDDYKCRAILRRCVCPPLSNNNNNNNNLIRFIQIAKIYSNEHTHTHTVHTHSLTSAVECEWEAMRCYMYIERDTFKLTFRHFVSFFSRGAVGYCCCCCCYWILYCSANS